MNTATAIADINKRLNNLLRLGTITDVKGKLCRVKTGDLLTDWRPFFTNRAGSARTSWRPTLGEQVMLLSVSGDLANAYILPALYSTEHPEPDDHPTRHRTVYPDDAVIEYDPETGALSATGIKTATIAASEHVTVDSPQTTFTGDVRIQKKLTVENGAEVHGAIEHTGKLTNKGGASFDGIDFGTHKHPGVRSGGDTSGNPQ